MTRISVLLPTFNAAATIRDTLESVKWADEILVVDSFSTDGTLDICREYGSRIIQHEYVNSAAQKNWAIPQCAYEWVLQIDCDEELENGAAREITERLNDVSPEIHAMAFRRRNEVLGRWVRVAALYPDLQTRLFRRDTARFEQREVHARIEAPGKLAAMQHDILHRGMKTISNQLRNLDRYSSYQAWQLHKHGKRFRWWQPIIRPPFVFAYYFLYKWGWLAGYRGFLVSMINVSFDFWAHAKLWEIQLNAVQNTPQD